MNIFVLGLTPAESAASAVDDHLKKQVLECFQMLAVAYPGKLLKKDGTPYSTAHEYHPLTQWVCAHQSNAKFTLQYAAAFANESHSRLGTSLASSYPWETAAELLMGVTAPPSTFPLYIPEYIRVKLLPGYELGLTPRTIESLELAVKGYRAYYLLEKSRTMAKFDWSCRKPDWYIEGCVKISKAPF